MRRTFERKRNLPAFRCDLGALEAFITEVLREFHEGEPHFSLNIDRPGESLEFDQFTDIREFDRLPSRVDQFSIYISDRVSNQNRSFRLWARSRTSASVDAKGSSEAWCAGLTESSVAFAQRHKTWYASVTSGVTGFLAGAFGSVPLLVSIIFGRDIFASWSGIVAFVVSWAILISVWANHHRLFPPVVLVLHREEHWLRRYNTEITVAAALLSAIAALLALFRGRG